MKKINKLTCFLCALLAVSPLSACNEGSSSQNKNEIVLRVASWDEYIDEGGEDSYVEGSLPLYEEFSDWYFEKTGKRVKVEYIPLQDNETMYNKIKMGDSYDLLCPSEYMMMKLAAEDKLQKFPDWFFDTTIESNYYVNNVSPYIQEVFQNGTLQNQGSWWEYSAGYMWGSTGFIFNPEKIQREEMKTWNALTSPACARKITAKDNVRDTYFMGLGMYYEEELLQLKSKYESGIVSRETYQAELKRMMNDTSVETMNHVKNCLIAMRKNLYGVETDEAKTEIITNRLAASYQWSGDAVYIMDESEDDANGTRTPIYLEYTIPESVSNLWFDGWTIMKDSKYADIAADFVNFLSMPENVVRNMYYIGYTSCIGGEDVFAYIEETYGAEEGDDVVPYDLSYFFGEGYILETTEEQTRRQLFAQYPDDKTIERLVVMEYFTKDANKRANRMWNTIK